MARALLLVLFLVVATRLIGFVVRFGNESLQMDLAAYYTAGESAAAGLSPYLNHVEHDPPIWDGVDVFRHSRFLYPPLAATVFRALAAIPYHPAKFLWMTASLAALAAALFLSVRLARLRAGPTQWLAIGFVACWFYPVLALLERGQVDAFTLLLLACALALMRSRRARASFAAGALIALATLVKLNCAFLIPFLLLRHRWRVVGGFLAAALLLAGLDLVVSGPGAVREYVVDEMPRIARHGEGGTRDMALPRTAFAPVLVGVEPGKVAKDGRVYTTAYYEFVLNAGLVQAWPGDQLRKVLGHSAPLSRVALGFLVLFVAGFALWQRRCGLPAGGDWGGGEPAYWLCVLIAILLCGPVTWVMSTVWLLAAVPLLLRELPALVSRRRAVAVGAAVLGLVLVGAPDPYGFFMLSPFGQGVFDGKYVLGQLLCLAGLLALWKEPGCDDASS